MICLLSLHEVEKAYRLDEAATLKDLKRLVRSSFPLLGDSYTLFYIDEDAKAAFISTETDFQVLKRKKALFYNIYIETDGKISLAQSKKEGSIIDQLDMISIAAESQPYQHPVSLSSQSQPAKKEEIHRVICSVCKRPEILGVRYQCLFCINFNLCETCEQKEDHPHSLLKVKQASKQLNHAKLYLHLSHEFSSKARAARRKERDEELQKIQKFKKGRQINSSPRLLDDTLQRTRYKAGELYLSPQILPPYLHLDYGLYSYMSRMDQLHLSSLGLLGQPYY